MMVCISHVELSAQKLHLLCCRWSLACLELQRGIKPALKRAREEVDGITRVETLRRGKGRCGKMKSMNERGLRGI